MTIRRDLEEIESKTNISRIYGGAIYHVEEERKTELPTVARMKLMEDEKKRIAIKAAEMVGHDETIFLGSGTTTLHVARQLEDRNDITVISNSLIILNELATKSKMNLIVVGGFLRRSEYSIIGHLANEMIKDLHVDKLIIGMRGIHSRFGLTSNHPQELLTDRMLMGISQDIIIVADHTKIGHVAASRTAQLKPPLTIITTENASPEIVDSIRNKGISVILV
jgi:DeoR/GlpR family transcriptional regulator of sugar metabolism